MRILLVEDDRPLAEGLRHALHREGYHVDVAVDGLLAREALRHEVVYEINNDEVDRDIMDFILSRSCPRSSEKK